MSGSSLMTVLTGVLVGLVASNSLRSSADELRQVPHLPTAPPPRAVESQPTVPKADLKAVVDGNNAFAIDLYKRLAEKDGNIVVSPYSISSSLAMTYAGAREKTSEEMAKTLRFTLPPERLHPAQAAVRQSLQSGSEAGKSEFCVANALWGQSGLSFNDEYLQLTRDYYGASFREVDFKSDSEGARRTINTWISEHTRGKIRSLLSRNDQLADTRLVLTNAVYFKGTWSTPFSKDRTIEDKFRISSDRTVPIRMMKGRFYCRCVEADRSKAVVIPYRGATQSMIVVVPDDIDGLPAVERALSFDKVRTWLDGPGCDVRLELPTFRMRERYSLVKVLGEMGMKLPFGSDGDFTGITDKLRLPIRGVFHEATIEVDEEGAEAAAATAAVVAKPISLKPIAPPRVLLVRADKPFLYLIVDNTSGAVLFAGRVTSL